MTSTAGAALDALVAEALGWRAWRERRGEYALCVVGAPKAPPPWQQRTPDPERP